MVISILFLIVCSWTLSAGLTPPTIIFPLNDLDDTDQAVDKEKYFTLSCKATGSLPLTFKWKKSGKDLIHIDPYQTITSSGHSSNLTFKTLSPYYDGKYQCLVSNPAGGTFSRKLRLKVTATSDFIIPKTVEKTVNVTVGRPLYIPCPQQKTGPDYSNFGALYSWGKKRRKVQMTLQMKQNIAQLPNGGLFFTYLDKEDIKKLEQYPSLLQLQCVVESGTSVYRSYIHKFNVIGTDSSTFAPEFAPGGEPKPMETAIQGKEKFLYCIASGSPAPKTKWYRVRDGKTKEIINEKDGFLISGTNFGRILHIPQVSKEQHEPGNYQCEVSNGQGKLLFSKLIKITVYVPPGWTVKPPPVKTVAVLGDDELVCEALGTPPPKYKWYHNGTEFSSDTELQPEITVDGNKLLLKKINRKNEGVFQCAVENNYGMLVSSTWLRVEARPPKIKKFGPFYIFRETKAVLQCDSNAAPVATNHWYKNDQLLTIGGRYSLGAKNSLIITDVVTADGGKYTCKAENDLGKNEASNTATVYDRTEIFRPPKKNLFIALKKALDLHCEARTDQRLAQFLTYKWLKDGRKIEYNSRVRWIENQNILKIEDANVDDGAMYTCIAFTDAPQKSEDRATAIADVKGVPFPPSDLKITDCHNRTSTITWKKGKENDAPITHFVVEQESSYFPEEWDIIKKITDPTKTSSTLQLTAWANLTFRMRAINKIGPSRASMPTPKGQCITSQYRPTMYPKNFRGVPGKAEELDIAWTPMTKLQANAPGLHYILKYNKILDNGGKEKHKVDIQNPNDAKFSIPNAGYYQLWEFQIIAKNNVGEGPSSDIVKSFSGQDAPTSKPENVKMGKISARSIELLWDRVLVVRGSVDGYNVYHWGQSKLVRARRRRREIPVGAKVFKANSTTQDVQEQNVTGLTPFTSYTLAIKAFNSGGEGPPSDEVKFDTLEDVPGPVSDFKAQAFSSYIFANWGEPAEKNGILLGYSIGAVKHEDKEPIKPVSQVQFVDVPIDKYEHLFKDMEPKTRYVIYLQAKTVIGPGPVMKADVKTIAPAKPAKPRAPLADAHSTTAVNITFLFGDTAGGYPLEFMVKYREKATNESFKETGWFDHLEKRWAIVDDLAENRLYQFVTVGRNKLGNSPDSPPTDARPVPAVASGKRESSPFYKAPWFIILIVLIILLVLVVLIVLLYRRRRGAKYPVGKREKERAGIMDQYPDEEEGMDMSKMDDNPPPYPSQGSLDKHNMSDDNDSLDGYGEGPEFKEDGSFIEEYGDDKKKLTDDKNKTASATFV